MGERGALPKDPAKRQRRNKPPEFEELPEGFEGEPPPLPGRSKYLQATRDWYATWCSSPQAAGFGATDWRRLAMLAPLVDAYYRKPQASLMSEIRQNESKLGATVADRQRLRWRLPGASPATEVPDEPTPAPKRRRPRGGGRDPRLRAV
ncbi:MAG TPA: hypothetical protein VGR26_14980 [Acidimicrobiales bacterium]|nr:hypothetical protein [Acidimicrobiales bacterium]